MVWHGALVSGLDADGAAVSLFHLVQSPLPRAAIYDGQAADHYCPLLLSTATFFTLVVTTV